MTVAVSLCPLFSGCSVTVPTLGGRLDRARLTDGVYDGGYKKGPVAATVRVTIENGRIAKVELLRHDTWRGRKAEPVIPKRIVERQSTDVDVVSGATVSSKVIMNAAQAAINKAMKQPGPARP